MGPHILALTAADYTPRLSGRATSETLGGARRTLSTRQGGSNGHPPPGCLEDEGNEPQRMAREARETPGTRRPPSGRTEFLSKANPLPQLPGLASSRARLTSLPSAFPGDPSSEPARTSQRSRPRRTAASWGRPAATHPARHLRGHVRLRGCSSALLSARPRRARARLQPALAQARSRQEAVPALGRVPAALPQLVRARGRAPPSWLQPGWHRGCYPDPTKPWQSATWPLMAF